MIPRSGIAVLTGLAAVAAWSAVAVPAGAQQPAPAPRPAAPIPTAEVNLRAIGTFDSTSGATGAEISAYDPTTKRLFVTNGAAKRVDIVDLADPTAPVKIAEFDILPYGADLQSVAVRNGIVAVALQPATKTDPGTVVFFRGSGPLGGGITVLDTVSVGALPDMITFTPDGSRLLVADEGEPTCNAGVYVDPVGSVTVVDLVGDATALTATATTIGFGSFDAATLRAQTPTVRVYGPGATAAQDLEPEYVAVDPTGTTAWVTLQENNAVAVVDLATRTVTGVVGLGFKDWSAPGNVLDPSDRDVEGVTGSGTNNRRINIGNRPIRGMYQPDAIATTTAGGATYLVTANEGDARTDWVPCINEEATGSQLTVADTSTAGLAALAADEDDLGRLKFTVAQPAANGGRNPYPNLTAPTPAAQDTLYAFGTRSMSIWSAQGSLVWDSGGMIEEYIAANFPLWHNINNGLASDWDTRSDDKGPEPEGVAVGRAFGRTFAFLGLERAGGIMTFDITDPTAPRLADYANPRMEGLSGPGANDVSPEGVQFVSAEDSPAGMPLVIATHEISGTTTVFALEPVGAHRYEAAGSGGRILDTRSGNRLAAGSTTTVAVPGLPAAGVNAVLVNVTVTDPVGPGFVSLYGGGAWPGTSTLNAQRAGRTVANATIVPVAGDGTITVYTQSATHLVIDLLGRFVAASSSAEGRMVPLAPARLLDTRDGGVRPAAGSTTDVTVLGRGGVPATGVAAVVATVTAAEGTGVGFVAAYPAGVTWPGTSTLNVDRAGQNVPNLAVIPVGAGGAVRLFTQPSTHLILDVVGYVTDATAPVRANGLMIPAGPGRLLDTRTGSRPTAGSTTAVPAGTPAFGIGAAAFVNVTATGNTAAGFVTGWSGQGTVPGTSSLNVGEADSTVAVAALVQRASAGTFALTTQSPTHLVVDRLAVLVGT